MTNSTIAAIASPPGMGAVALIRISGPEAAKVVDKVFRGKSYRSWIPRHQHFGAICNSEGAKLDDVLLTYFPSPASFTGEDVIELGCHGGVVVTKQILDAVFEAGAKPAEAGEFSQRAFFNGRIDLTQAEAIMDLISAKTDLAARAAQGQLEGILGKQIENLREALVSVTAHLEAYIDFPEEDITPDSAAQLIERFSDIEATLKSLLSTADQGKILREGLKTVIAGAPNAGKSSLLNLFIGFDRAIVNEQAGTTRDTIEEMINLNGIPIRLIDTAGIRESEGEIEKEGIRRSQQELELAELVLLVIDSSESRDRVNEIEIPESTRVIRILNKSDLQTHQDWEGDKGIRLSCLDESAASVIRELLYREISANGPIESASLIAINSRHQFCLGKALQSVEKAKTNLEAGESPEFIAMDLRDALGSVGEVIGKTDIEEILGEIFSTFCIGK